MKGFTQTLFALGGPKFRYAMASFFKVEKTEGKGPCQTRYTNCYFTAAKYATEGKPSLQGETNKVTVDERQTGNGKLQRERLQ